ncbi:MAG: hypothetical protein WCY97_04740 [Methanothrix sp.]|jgi:hypothetical protein|uniref:Uncharacterized protein n=1 Tax=Methanothrix harundinacea TaxID=301375 RepID=A0A117LEX1_9EURY|nr:MAG: hypothetical protein XD72_2232 [Methanothrix harundinacea]MCP1393292.1 hypothetical protein [Methanothrix harundinacea]MDI9398339.1 hypothetical protein [Euryarchaeota archaeon]
MPGQTCRPEVLSIALIALLIYAATVPASGASTKEVLEGLTIEPHERWTTGAVKGWSAGDCIPFRFTVENRGSSPETAIFRLAFDHQRDGAIGIVSFESFVVPAGNIDGPYFQGGEGYYLWNVMIPADTTYVLLWCARTSEEAGSWSGASMHVSAKNGGSRDVPIMIKDLGDPRPPCRIVGPESVCEDRPMAIFSYGDEPTNLEFAWRLSSSNDDLGLWTESSIEIDWSIYPFGKYLLSLDVYKDQGGVLTRIESCCREVLYVESPAAFIEMVD